MGQQVFEELFPNLHSVNDLVREWRTGHPGFSPNVDARGQMIVTDDWHHPAARIRALTWTQSA